MMAFPLRRVAGRRVVFACPCRRLPDSTGITEDGAVPVVGAAGE